MPLPQTYTDFLFLLGGFTGSGKTELIRHFQSTGIQALDLEALCNHDGSAFAPLRFGVQPGAYHFHKSLLKCWSRFQAGKPLFIEREGGKIGRIGLPSWLVAQMEQAPVIWLNVNRNIRLNKLAAVISRADPLQLSLCLEKLSGKLGSSLREQAFQFVDKGQTESLVDLLLRYYDNAPTYAEPSERICARIDVPVWNTEAVATQVLQAALASRKLMHI